MQNVPFSVHGHTDTYPSRIFCLYLYIYICRYAVHTLLLCMCVFVWGMYVTMSVCMHMCVCVDGSQRSMLGAISHHSLPGFWGQSLLLNLELTSLACLAIL